MNPVRISPLLFIILLFPGIVFSQTTIASNDHSKPVEFGIQKISQALDNSGERFKIIKSSSGSVDADITILIDKNHPGLQKEGFEISNHHSKVVIHAVDPVGAMYGAFDVAEQIQIGKGSLVVSTKKINPHFTVRALKFNLPWSPYRTGEAMDQHLEICRDLSFWQAFLDQMAVNRFNLLSLWNVHPFSFMVKPDNFPGANNFSGKEMAEWRYFWTSLFRMCRERGIEPFIVNWNIAVSPEFAKTYGVIERNDTSSLVRRYTREVVTQVIDEYPDLAGIGITLADWMSNFRSEGSMLPEMTPKEREDWIEETVVAGMKNAKRPVKFLHRSVLSADPQEMRRVIDNANLPDTTLVEIKFNWSHGHSTPSLLLTHDAHSGKVDDGYWNPLPHNYRIQWMIRNEDIFILRWGQPDFIRRHIAENSKPYVNGYFVGSEGYIPAKDFSHVSNGHRTWNYAFEKQWLFYELWGRLLYDPTTPESVFESSFEARYKVKEGNSLLKAYKAAGNMPLRLASFHAATWDYTLYAEGFLAPFASNGGMHDDVSSFLSIDEFINHRTLDPRYVSIVDFVKNSNEGNSHPAGKVSPLTLADSLQADSEEILAIVKKLPKANATLACEIEDLKTWAHLSLYFADKIRAGVALQNYRISKNKKQQQIAIGFLESCRKHWINVSEITSAHYHEVPYIDDLGYGGKGYQDAFRFSWKKLLPQVERDIELASKMID